MIKETIENLTEDQKNKLVDEINELPTEELGGNATLKSVSEDEELSKKIAKLTPKELLDQNIAANYRSRSILGDLLPQMSKKNLIKIFLATLALPENNSNLTFGGTRDAIKLCHWAFIQAQVAENSRMYVVSTEALAMARRQQKIEAAEKLAKEEESNG